ncbi:DUF1800 domain-containing protein [Acuticoccus sp.]|uniref:DUF1800 domain-containing protein n=1 Tax=Acuticoccus sp. TaxID=1904378 RepID=UPI003B518C39
MRSPDLIAATRFGLGPKAGELERARPDPVAYVARQLDDAAAATITGLPTTADVREVFIDKQRAYREARRASRRASDEEREELEAERLRLNRARRDLGRRMELAEVAARYRRGVTTDAPFVERLVLFWSNHLAIERFRLHMRFLAGPYEREAIRPHVLGDFGAMLRAAIPHPAMLIYLDNARSVGPNSRVGRRRGAGEVNENLAREVLELHTLGAGGGYTQDDVEALALVLTGWSGGFHVRRRNPVFDRRRHDFGARTILGKTYRETGEGQLAAVLTDLALHPSTATHLATKLARHVTGDDASDALIGAMRDAYIAGGADLGAMTRALVRHPEAWRDAPEKMVPPYDYVVAGGRALDLPELPPQFVVEGVSELGQPLWKPPSPAGWPDADAAFMGGDSLLERVDYTREFAQVHGGGAGDVRVIARALFGDDLDPFVAEAIDRAEDQRQALVLLLMSPPFQRR